MNGLRTQASHYADIFGEIPDWVPAEGTEDVVIPGACVEVVSRHEISEIFDVYLEKLWNSDIAGLEEDETTTGMRWLIGHQWQRRRWLGLEETHVQLLRRVLSQSQLDVMEIWDMIDDLEKVVYT